MRSSTHSTHSFAQQHAHMEWAKQAAAQAKQLRERAAQEASKLQESYKDGTLASPLAERLSLDAVSASLKEGRQKLREGVETAIVWIPPSPSKRVR